MDVPGVSVLNDKLVVDPLEKPVGNVLLLEITLDISQVIKEEIVIVVFVLVLVRLYLVDHMRSLPGVKLMKGPGVMQPYVSDRVPHV